MNDKLSHSTDKIILSNINSQSDLSKSASHVIKSKNTTKQEKLKRATSVYIPSKCDTYGPKAILKKINEDNLLLIQDPLSQRLSWTTQPSVVLVIKKHCAKLDDLFCEIIQYLINHHNLTVYVEKEEFETDHAKENKSLQECLKKSVHLFNECLECLENKIDLVICLGGDGTLLHVSSLFQRSCPPVLSINMGSLGFLCPFDFENYPTYVDSVIKGNVPILLRNRLVCKFESLNGNGKSRNNSSADEQANEQNSQAQQNGLNSNHVNGNGGTSHKRTEWIALNEIVVDRGSSPYLSNLELYLNDYLITVVQGDGIIISSTTGSTAYAMAAGASMCHPSVPALILCPICPHSLAFRPIIVPAGVELKICLSHEARNTASCSVDGHRIGQLSPGDNIVITSSEYPLPSICRYNQLIDWFEGLGSCLHWNIRKKQLPIDACYSTNPNNNDTSTGSNESKSE